MKEEKTALITGGAKRLGRSISKELARAGYNVIIHYNSSENDALSLREELLEFGVDVFLLQADLLNDKETLSLFDKCEKLESKLAEEVRRDTQEGKVAYLVDELQKAKSTVNALIGENKRRIQENYELRHPRYVFSEIPNDCDGQRFIDDVKKYFNKGTYRMRVRGQHVKEEYKGTGVTTHGQNIEQSTHLRVYIEEKD